MRKPKPRKGWRVDRRERKLAVAALVQQTKFFRLLVRSVRKLPVTALMPEFRHQPPKVRSVRKMGVSTLSLSIVTM